MATKNMSPLEDVEQMELVRWLDERGLKFTAIPNSTYTTSFKQKRHNTDMGVRAGFPDLVVLIPPNRSGDGWGYLLAIEMKRRTGGVVSEAQRSWIDALNDLGSDHVQSYICKGSDEAKTVVKHYMKEEAYGTTTF